MAHIRHILHSANQKSNDQRKSNNGRVLLLTLPNQTTRNSSMLAQPVRAPPKTLTYNTSISFAEFKRNIGEKLGISCTRVFLLSGGEVDTVSQLDKDEMLICTSGEPFIAPTVKTFENNLRAAQNSSPPPASLSRSNSAVVPKAQLPTTSSPLNRFQSVVRRVQQNRGKHLGTSSRTNLTTVVPMTRNGGNGRRTSIETDAAFGRPGSPGNLGSPGSKRNDLSNTLSTEESEEDMLLSSGFSTTEAANYESSLSRSSLEGRRRSSVWDTDEISMLQHKRAREIAKQDTLSRKGLIKAKLANCWDCVRSKFIRIEGGTSPEDPVREIWSLPLIFPEHPYRATWDIALTLLVIYYSLAVPLRMAFELANPSDGETLFDILCSFLFIFDIGLNFCTAMKVKGILITDHTLIAKIYLKSWFIIDFVSSIPIDLLFLDQAEDADEGSGARSGIKLLKGLRIFKLLRVLRLQRIINRLETHHHVNPSMLRMGKLVGILITTWHWLGCSYWGVAAMEHGTNMISEDYWIPPARVWQSNTLGEQYAFAFFWAVVVTSGIGWDIIPSTTLQIVFTTFAIVTGLLIYAIIIGSASTLLANIDSAEAERKSKMNDVKSLLRTRHVPKNLSSEIFEFYEYLLSCNNTSIDENSILSELPQTLRSRLNIAINRQIIKSIPVFAECSDNAMALLIEQLYQLVILPGEYVMEQGNHGNEMYFVVRGKLQVLRDTVQGHRVTMARRGEGEFFGEIALFEDEPRRASVKAITYCDLLTLPREGFEFIKLHFPTIMDKVKTAAERRKISIQTVNSVVEKIGMGDDPKVMHHNKNGKREKDDTVDEVSGKINSAFLSGDSSFRPVLMPNKNTAGVAS